MRDECAEELVGRLAMVVLSDLTREDIGSGQVVMGFAGGLIERDGEVEGTTGDRSTFLDLARWHNSGETRREGN